MPRGRPQSRYRAKPRSARLLWAAAPIAAKSRETHSAGSASAAGPWFRQPRRDFIQNPKKSLLPAANRHPCVRFQDAGRRFYMLRRSPGPAAKAQSTTRLPAAQSKINRAACRRAGQKAFNAAPGCGTMEQTAKGMAHMRIELPYGQGYQTLEIQQEALAGVLTARMPQAPQDQAGLVAQALARPFGSAPLAQLARGKKQVVILASDHTRPVPSRLLMPALLDQIREGSPEAEGTILIATGCHRQTSRRELAEKFGEQIVRRERIVIHDCDDEAMLCDLGRLPSGGRLRINRLAAQADLLVSEGFIEPHFFAGFSGG
jgi:hypothetical protein